MADITMCTGGQCTLRKICYRFTAPANEHRQSVADFTNGFIIIDDVPYCPEFLPDTREDK